MPERSLRPGAVAAVAGRVRCVPVGTRCRPRSALARGDLGAGVFGPGSDFLEVGDLFTELFVAKVFGDGDAVARTLGSNEKLIELGVNRLAVAVLGVLDEEDHEECDDGGGSVDYELPGIGEVKDRSADTP